MTHSLRTARTLKLLPAAFAMAWLAACAKAPIVDRVRASGQIEATDVRVAAQVGGRLLELRVAEGDRVNAGDVVARLDTSDAELALERARTERQQVDAQLRLLLAGSRVEDIRQAEAQLSAADADIRAAEVERAAAQVDVDRFEALVASNSGSRKQRDDAVTRRNLAAERVDASRGRARAASEALGRLRAGARREDVDAARARVAASAAQIAILEKAVSDATVTAPMAGIVTETLADAGEQMQPRAPLVVLTDLDHVWANVYVDEPVVPLLRLGQQATLFTDAGGAGLPGTVSFISSRAEFTPRNVQTAADRSKLVYRVKVSAVNADGVLKVGMPVEAELSLSAAPK